VVVEVSIFENLPNSITYINDETPFKMCFTDMSGFSANLLYIEGFIKGFAEAKKISVKDVKMEVRFDE